MTRHVSSTRSRELGAELKKRRKAARWRAGELAKELGWSQTKVSRMESGERGVSEVDAAIYLTFCGVRREELDDLLNLTREDENDETWLQEHGERLPDELRTLIFHETTAAALGSYEPLSVPGLLQTEDYARAVFEFAGVLPENRIDHAVKARLDRQGLLRRRDPPQCEFFIHENALREPVGTLRVMHEQLLHLVFLTSRPQHAIRIVPAGIGPYAVWVGPFMLMSYREHSEVVYVEGLTTSVFLEKEHHINRYRGVLKQLDRVALDVGQSRDWLARLASAYDRPEKGSDVHA